jgi:hypothetical protein
MDFADAKRIVRRLQADDLTISFVPEAEPIPERVRALFFLYAIHRFHIPLRPGAGRPALIPFAGYGNLLKRRFEEAIDIFLAAQAATGPSAAISSALAAGYKSLAFQTLADQVRRSVRSVRGNQWMLRAGHPADYSLSLRPELLADAPVFPILRETTPVRMDLTHSGWSDIFFLGMDFPVGLDAVGLPGPADRDSVFPGRRLRWRSEAPTKAPLLVARKLSSRLREMGIPVCWVSAKAHEKRAMANERMQFPRIGIFINRPSRNRLLRNTWATSKYAPMTPKICVSALIRS